MCKIFHIFHIPVVVLLQTFEFLAEQGHIYKVEERCQK